MGSAVRRNRIRRLLREAVRTSQAIPRSGYDIVIVPRQAVSDRDVNVQAVLDDLDRVIARMGLREGTGD
jgi:ribonuclease P protein component